MLLVIQKRSEKGGGKEGPFLKAKKFGLGDENSEIVGSCSSRRLNFDV